MPGSRLHGSRDLKAPYGLLLSVKGGGVSRDFIIVIGNHLQIKNVFYFCVFSPFYSILNKTNIGILYKNPFIHLFSQFSYFEVEHEITFCI